VLSVTWRYTVGLHTMPDPNLLLDEQLTIIISGSPLYSKLTAGSVLQDRAFVSAPQHTFSKGPRLWKINPNAWTPITENKSQRIERIEHRHRLSQTVTSLLSHVSVGFVDQLRLFFFDSQIKLMDQDLCSLVCSPPSAMYRIELPKLFFT
jgi:hypothetical protein